jgi:predicted nucleic acid-binding protein
VARVFVDTNVLFPFSVMDLMLALTEDGVHDVLWTDALLDEWERVIVREQRRSADAASRITAAIRDFFADSQIPENAYAHLVDDMPSSDPDDRNHIAAAVAGNADVIITWNRVDFPAEPLADLGVRVSDPDEYLLALLAEVPDEVVATVVRLAGEKRRPPMTVLDLIENLATAGVPAFAAALRKRLVASGSEDGS